MSCEGPAGRDGSDGRDGAVLRIYEEFAVRADEWNRKPTDSRLPFEHYYFVKSIPQFSYNYFKYGVYNTYHVTLDNYNNEVQDPLASTYYFMDEGVPWQEAFICEYREREITILVFHSDFKEDPWPGNHVFRFVAVY